MITYIGYIAYIAYTVLFINTLIFWFFLKKKSLDSLKWFTYYLSISFCIQIIAKSLGINKIPNLPLLHLYSLLEFIIISIFYKKVLVEETGFQKWINYILGIGSVLIIANSLFLQPLTAFNSNAKAFSQIMIIGYAIYYYFSILHERTNATTVLNLLNAAILIYFAGSFFVFMFSDLLLKQLDKDTQLLFWIFNALLYLVFQLIVIFAGWKAYLTTKKSSR